MLSTRSAQCCICLAGVLLLAGKAPAQEHGLFSHLQRKVALSASREVPESSGIAPGRSPDVFWTHNDSGSHPPRVYAFRLSRKDRSRSLAADLGWVVLQDARMRDWEDLSAGPNRMLYILDGGDDPPCGRDDKEILRFEEPAITPGTPLRATVSWASARFEYPDHADPAKPATRPEDRYDAESLLVHPTGGDLYIVTKRDHRGSGVARVYRLRAPEVRWNSPEVHVLTFVADISDRVPHMATGADIDPGGRHVVVRNYVAAYEFTVPEGKDFKETFRTSPRKISLLGELQGEAICYTPDGQELVTTSEVQLFGGKQFPIYVTTRPAPATTTAPE